ncbi:MAG TPA: Vms1/Ankzf1 family peptidyl-tRNA hydrolase, partial [Phycisphaerae bacterium]|nr:Vms1/Ankzf1 family peptidyl-tRNA hydrolase [Phycisphaerae bacterium]
SGDIKNHVKKGGWSQKRYQRRRQNELVHYGKEVADQLARMYEERPFARLVLLGSIEARGAIQEQLPQKLQDVLVGDENADLHDDEAELLAEAREFVERAQQRDDHSLWKRIKGEILSDGMAEAGCADVWLALANGRADAVVMERELRRDGWKCRACANITPEPDATACAYCRADDGYTIDFVDEIIRQAERTSASVEFIDPTDELQRIGGMACSTRY